MYRLAHLSDLHLPFHLSNPFSLLNKRLIGFLSWQFNRRHIHLQNVLENMKSDLYQQKPDHMVITGDIVNISLPEEYQKATDWLEQLQDPEHLSVIPGNHDFYTRLPPQQLFQGWKNYMLADHHQNLIDDVITFPYIRYRGPLAIIGVSTACPMPPFSAAGLIGPHQLEKLEQILAGLSGRDYCRVILMHHPPFASDRHKRKQLKDIPPFLEIIRKHGVELILHGHMHVSSLRVVDGPVGNIPVIGVPSASASLKSPKGYARYHIYEISKSAKGWDIHVNVRGLQKGPFSPFMQEGNFDIMAPAPPFSSPHP